MWYSLLVLSNGAWISFFSRFYLPLFKSDDPACNYLSYGGNAHSPYCSYRRIASLPTAALLIWTTNTSLHLHNIGWGHFIVPRSQLWKQVTLIEISKKHISIASTTFNDWQSAIYYVFIIGLRYTLCFTYIFAYTRKKQMVKLKPFTKKCQDNLNIKKNICH